MEKCVNQIGTTCRLYKRLRDCRECSYYHVEKEEEEEEEGRDKFDNC